MKISYKKLWIMLAEQEMTKQEFREKLQIASGTMTKLNKGQWLRIRALKSMESIFHEIL